MDLIFTSLALVFVAYLTRKLSDNRMRDNAYIMQAQYNFYHKQKGEPRPKARLVDEAFSF